MTCSSTNVYLTYWYGWSLGVLGLEAYLYAHNNIQENTLLDMI